MPGPAKHDGEKRGRMRPLNRTPKGSPGSTSVKRQRRGPDPTGRLDIAAAKALELLGTRAKDPRVRVAFKHAQPVLEGVIRQYLGPRNPHAQQLSRAIRKGVEILGDLAKEQARVNG